MTRKSWGIHQLRRLGGFSTKLDILKSPLKNFTLQPLFGQVQTQFCCSQGSHNRKKHQFATDTPPLQYPYPVLSLREGPNISLKNKSISAQKVLQPMKCGAHVTSKIMACHYILLSKRTLTSKCIIRDKGKAENRTVRRKKTPPSCLQGSRKDPASTVGIVRNRWNNSVSMQVAWTTRTQS